MVDFTETETQFPIKHKSSSKQLVSDYPGYQTLSKRTFSFRESLVPRVDPGYQTLSKRTFAFRESLVPRVVSNLSWRRRGFQLKNTKTRPVLDKD